VDHARGRRLEEVARHRAVDQAPDAPALDAALLERRRPRAPPPRSAAFRAARSAARGSRS
jgi:hypothetical protein